MSKEPITSPLPTVDEVLCGETQGGVPRPTFSVSPEEVEAVETRTFTAAEMAPCRSAPVSRYSATKTWLRIMFRGR